MSQEPSTIHAAKWSKFRPELLNYLCEFLQQRQNQFVPLNQQAAADQAEPLTPLDLQHRLAELYPDETSHQVTQIASRLQQLVIEHRTLAQGGEVYHLALDATEAEILALLHYKLTEAVWHNHSKLLVIDDSPQNVRLLGLMLQRQGYQLLIESKSINAISSVKHLRPDLVLLDIMMPVIDGYEICRKLKEDPETSSIPVIFISASNNILDKLRAFRLGGADYITKPFQYEEVLARVEYQLQIRALQQRLESRNMYLQNTNLQRQQEAQLLQLVTCVFNQMSDYVLVSNQVGEIIYASDSAAQNLGYPNHNLLQMSLYDIDQALNPNLWQAAWRRLQKKRHFVTKSRHRTQARASLDVTLNLHRFNLEAVEYCCLIVQRIETV